MQTPNEGSSLGDLLTQLVSEVSALAQRELDLVRTEVSQKVAQVGRGTGMIAVGSALSYAGLLAFMATGVIALVQYVTLPLWVATLAVGAVVFIIGLLITVIGRNSLRIRSLAPQRTLQTLRDNADWAAKRSTT